MPIPEGMQEMYNSLSAAQKAEVDARVALLASQEADLRNAISVLRQWADDAQSTTVTSGNAVAVLTVVVGRLGVFFDRFADLLVLLGKE